METLDQTNPPADNSGKIWTKYLKKHTIILKLWRVAQKKTETGKECTLERQYQQGEKFKTVAFFLRALSNSWAAKG